jgi:hypothetical protein
MHANLLYYQRRKEPSRVYIMYICGRKEYVANLLLSLACVGLSLRFLFYLFVFSTAASIQLLLLFYFFQGYLSWFFAELKLFELLAENGISFLQINERTRGVLLSVFLLRSMEVVVGKDSLSYWKEVTRRVSEALLVSFERFMMFSSRPFVLGSERLPS